MKRMNKIFKWLRRKEQPKPIEADPEPQEGDIYKGTLSTPMYESVIVFLKDGTELPGTNCRFQEPLFSEYFYLEDDSGTWYLPHEIVSYWHLGKRIDEWHIYRNGEWEPMEEPNE